MKGIHRRQLLAVSSLSVAAALGKTWIGAAAAKTSPAGAPGPSFFVKGVYQQPAEKMALWKSRGINTIFTVNAGADIEAWTREAIRQGLYMVREPLGVDTSGQKPSFSIVDPKAFERDAKEPRLLAFALVDEPSNLKPGGAGIDYQDVVWPPSEIDGIARAWSAGGKPLWINHVGNHVNNKYLEAIMSDYADSPFIDWLSHDCYPIDGGEDLLLDLDGYTSTVQGHAIDRLSRWSGGKPQFSVIGISQFDKARSRETTPSDFLAQAWSSIIHGAIGIIYFPFQFRPEFSYDATPPQLLTELGNFHSDIDAIEPILVDKVKGGRRPFSVLRCSRQAIDIESSNLPYPFEASSTPTQNGEYKIILNISDQPAELTYKPWNLSRMLFQAYQCRRGHTPDELGQG